MQRNAAPFRGKPLSCSKLANPIADAPEIAEYPYASIRTLSAFVLAAYRRLHVVAAVAVEDTAPLRLGTDPLDGGDGRACFDRAAKRAGVCDEPADLRITIR